MNKKEWERALLKNLKSLSRQERKEVLEYYREMYGDKLDAGFSEQEILREFGSPKDCAKKILMENGNATAARQITVSQTTVETKSRKPWWKVFLIVGIALTACLLLLCIPSFSNTKIKEMQYVENSENVIDDLTIDFSNAAVTVYVDDSVDALSVIYPQTQTASGKNTSVITVNDKDGALGIKEKPVLIYNLCSWRVKTPKITVQLPSDRVYALDLSVDNGSITLTGDLYNVEKLTLSTCNGSIDTRGAQISCETQINVEVNNGQIKLGSISAQSLNASTDNGEIVVNDGTVSGVAYLETDNGKISVNGKFTASEFIAETDNGEINASGGLIDAQKITLDTDVGAIVAKVAGKQSDYTISVDNDHGSTNVSSQTGGSKQLSVNVSVGEIKITFEE